ncbi:hypothetical protein BE11_19715 [Sorangium cellulosum]|nr:hypothetical protein BE11_19715 [Sorangium cellulosum]
MTLFGVAASSCGSQSDTEDGETRTAEIREVSGEMAGPRQVAPPQAETQTEPQTETGGPLADPTLDDPTATEAPADLPGATEALAAAPAATDAPWPPRPQRPTRRPTCPVRPRAAPAAWCGWRVSIAPPWCKNASSTTPNG